MRPCYYSHFFFKLDPYWGQNSKIYHILIYGVLIILTLIWKWIPFLTNNEDDNEASLLWEIMRLDYRQAEMLLVNLLIYSANSSSYFANKMSDYPFKIFCQICLFSLNFALFLCLRSIEVQNCCAAQLCSTMLSLWMCTGLFRCGLA